MKEKIIIHPQVGEVLLVKGGSRHHIRLTVHPKRGIRVSLPSFVSFRAAEKFLDSKISWILDTKERIDKKQKLSETDISDGASLNIIGGEILFVKEPYREKIVVRSSGSTSFTIFYGENHSREFVLSGLIMLIRRQAKSYLPSKVSELAAKYGFRYNRLFLKNNRSNWGSCSSKGNINLNIHLMRLSSELCDHVILHELCHLKHRNHGLEFHALLNKLCSGQEKEFNRELRRYKPHLS